MSSGGLETAIEASQSLFERGYYKNAATKLQEFLDGRGPNLRASIELAHCHISQGFFCRAHAVLKGLEEAESLRRPFTSNNVLCLLVKLMSLMVSTHTTYCFGEAVTSTTSLIETLTSITIDSQDARYESFCYLYSYRTIAHARQSANDLYNEPLQVETDRLMHQANLCLESNKLQEAFNLVKILPTSSQRQQVLESIRDSPMSTSLLKSRSVLAIATRNGEKQSAAVEDALKVLEEQHAFLAQEFRADLCISDLLDNKPCDPAPIQTLLQVVQELDYPIGACSILRSVHDVYFTLGDFENATIAEQDLEAQARDMGTTLLHDMFQATVLARSQQASGFADRIKEAATLLYSQLESSELYQTLGHLCFMLCQVHLGFQELSVAQTWLRRCQDQWAVCGAMERAIAKSMGLAVESRARAARGETDFAEFLELVDTTLESEPTFEGRIEFEMRCLCTASSHLLGLQGVSPEEKRRHLASYHKRMQVVVESAHGTLADTFQATLLTEKAIVCTLDQHSSPETVQEETALNLLNDALKIHQRLAKGRLSYELINTRQEMGLLWHTIFTKRLQAGLPTAWQALDEAYTAFECCLQGWKLFGISTQVADCQYWLALTLYEAVIQGRATAESLTSALLTAEEGFDQKRNEISISKGMNAVRMKQALAQDKHVRDVYRFAVQAMMLTADFSGLWDWVQKSKARSLSDLLGLGASVPQSLRDAIKADAAARDILSREDGIREKSLEGTITARFRASRDLFEYQAEMRKHPLTSQLLDIRLGLAHTFKDLARLAADPESGLPKSPFALVDFVMKGQEIYLLIVSMPTTLLHFRRVNCSLETVQAWRQVYLEDEHGMEDSLQVHDLEPDQPLRELDCLIEFIVELTQPDDLLVLCTSGPLDAIPLHALHVPFHTANFDRYKPALIERNPVVYTSSITSFIQCCRASQQACPTRASSFTSVYETDQGETLDFAERQEAYAHVEQLAGLYNGTANTGSSVTPATLQGTWPDSRLVLFHGHCEQSTPDMTSQALVLGTGEVDPSNRKPTHFPVPEFFNLRLQSPLIILVACGSSTQQISLGDEPLGIVTALLCAGAGSVLGTIWQVRSAPARAFAEEFLQGLYRELAGSGNEVVDLAMLVREAVLKIKDTTNRDVLDWAPFVLHGAWSIQRWDLGVR